MVSGLFFHEPIYNLGSSVSDMWWYCVLAGYEWLLLLPPQTECLEDWFSYDFR